MQDDEVHGPVTPTEPRSDGPPNEVNTNLEPIEGSPRNAEASFVLDQAQPLDRASFPHQPRHGGTQLPTTIPNVNHLLVSYGIVVRYNTIRKKLLVSIPGSSGAPDNADNVAIAQIISLATLNGLSSGQVPIFVAAVGDRNQFNPVADWITSRPWDGIDRLSAFYDTLVQREGYPKELKQVLMHRWLISGVAAALKPSAFRARGVLTLQGPQGIGKTAFVRGLVDDPVLREEVIKLDHHLDGSNKDSIITATSHWIVEIGELDSSFRKDIARLKGFLTADRDKVRRPYGKADSEYPRRTIFCATVNDQNFLVDSTGNSRWWTIPVTRVNYEHGIDMQQLFAQLVVDFHKGEPWWLSRDEEALLDTYNKEHRSISAIRERVLAELELERLGEPDLPAMMAIEVLIVIGVRNPGNAQCKECAAVLREYLGEPKKIKGNYKWRVPLKEPTFSQPVNRKPDRKGVY